MRVVDQPIQDGVGEGRFINDVVPCVNGELAGDECCAASITIFDDFHQVSALWRGHAFRPPVIENEQVGFDKLPEDAWKAPVVMGELQFGEEPR